MNNKEISLAPMLDVTTSHYRRFVRLTSKNTVLFTEMIVSNTVIHISTDKLIERLGEYDENTVVQIGGSDPKQIAEAVKIIQKLGFDKFNLNCGCPSSRVQQGCFGAILMLKKELVAEILNTTYETTGIIMSLKIRTGVDEFDNQEFLETFVSYIKANTKTNVFYIHARKCWLKGLSPKQNRNVPVLNYEAVYKLKEKYFDLKIILNGGIKGDNLDRIGPLDGAMIGREAIKNIMVFWEIEEKHKNFNNNKECECNIENIQNKECESYKCKKRKKLAIKNYIKCYFEFYDPEEKIRGYHIQPILNILSGIEGCKRLKQKINELLVKKETIKVTSIEIDKIL